MNPQTLKILLIADVNADAMHSSVEGLFKSRPDIDVYCYKIFFDKNHLAPSILADRTVLPYRFRRRGLWNILNSILDLNQYHAIVVRNLFTVLRQIQKNTRMNMALGFWESFPHSHRRFEQALHEKKAIFRKRLEFWFSSRNERSAIGRCDFYMPITETHKSIYYPDLTIPYFATPMGFDFQRYPLRGKLMGGGPIKFVHIGTVDALRRIDMVNSAFMAQNKDYILDYYTYSRNDTVDQLRKISDLRIRVHEGLPQSRLFEAIRQADVGVCFFPHTKTHITASPTKTIEYGALGLTILVNPMPEYQRLIDAEYAFVCDFNEIAIRNKVEEILNVDRFTLYQMGRQFQRRVFEQRNYDQMAKELFSFIDHQVVLKTGSR